MSKALLPQAFWFRLAVPCPRVAELPLADRRQRLLDLPESCRLPAGARLDGQTPWTEVRVGWNAAGLGIVVRAEGLADGQLTDRPENFADVQLWVDTRDTRDVSRATRFCHRFAASIRLRNPGKKLVAEVAHRPIARALADPPMASAGLIEARAELLGREGWTLAVFLPAQAMNGFDPETNRRLGFAYQVSDHLREDQFLGVGRDFPIGENPSLWSTIELTD